MGVSRIAGSRRGSTFQKTGVNHVIRKRAVPVQKRTERQDNAKQLLQNTAGIWRTLSGANKTTWENESANYTRKDSLGNNYNFNGQQMQVGSNSNLIRSAIAPLAAPAAFSAIPAQVLTALVADQSAQTIYLTTQFDPVPADLIYTFSIGRFTSALPVSWSPENFKFIYSIDAGGSTVFNSWSLYLSAWGVEDILPGTYAPVISQSIRKSTGQLGPAPQQFGPQYFIVAVV